MLWPIRFVEGSQSGKRKKDDVGRENVLTNQVQQKCSRFHQKLMEWWMQRPHFRGTGNEDLSLI
jgi:hypothetical protein